MTNAYISKKPSIFHNIDKPSAILSKSYDSNHLSELLKKTHNVFKVPTILSLKNKIIFNKTDNINLNPPIELKICLKPQKSSNSPLENREKTPYLNKNNKSFKYFLK